MARKASPGHRLRTARLKADISQRELADLIGAQREQMSKWEAGQPMSPVTAQRLMDALPGLDLSDVLTPNGAARGLAAEVGRLADAVGVLALDVKAMEARIERLERGVPARRRRPA